MYGLQRTVRGAQNRRAYYQRGRGRGKPLTPQQIALQDELQHLVDYLDLEPIETPKYNDLSSTALTETETRFPQQQQLLDVSHLEMKPPVQKTMESEAEDFQLKEDPGNNDVSNVGLQGTGTTFPQQQQLLTELHMETKPIKTESEDLQLSLFEHEVVQSLRDGKAIRLEWVSSNLL